ncbi:MAG: 5-oxoprolinase subunit B family protein [Fimbriimonadaceae bacterium]
MRIEPLGDLAFILRELPSTAAATAHAIDVANITGVTDVVPCGETVGVYFRVPVSKADLTAACAAAKLTDAPAKVHVIPVCYKLGNDVQGVAAHLNLTTSTLIKLHSSTQFTCFAIGFCPGFAYLGPLPEALRGIPRLGAPRVRTAPGSVGVTGDQTAVYPLDRPGGWPIIGMTPLILVDELDDYFPIAVGDRVKFEPITVAEFEQRRGLRL